MHPDAREVLITEQQIANRVAELGRQISRDYAGREILVVGILKGAVLFLADLVRHIDVPVRLDFMAVSSYGATTDSSGVVQIIKDLEQSIEGRHVLIVEDIVDTGLTLKYLQDNLATRRPASLRICTLLDKPGRRKVPVQVDYNGFVIPDEFVVGYGLDYAERYRNLRDILVLKPEVYQK
ncbi:MAG: hypoxanthine phosphoribosyltransferase [Bacillota bacterium]|uniref:hypoxanthine phosphoribosyltransferase n=1 Tax=Desulfurispora thermophila TaxID=265470 RepID=UPI00035F7655|nr:hypoxanthine phosphoribosyltransferase [Desulfurispora thermophila]